MTQRLSDGFKSKTAQKKRFVVATLEQRLGKLGGLREQLDSFLEPYGPPFKSPRDGGPTLGEAISQVASAVQLEALAAKADRADLAALGEELRQLRERLDRTPPEPTADSETLSRLESAVRRLAGRVDALSANFAAARLGFSSAIEWEVVREPHEGDGPPS